MDESTNTDISLHLVGNTVEALKVWAIRNKDCHKFMTHNSGKIGFVEQLVWYFRTYRSLHKQGKMNLYLVRFLGSDIGYGITSKTTGVWTVTGCLKPEYRGIGQGLLLFQKLVDSIDADEVWLDVLANNYPARNLYEKMGFKNVNMIGNLIIMRLKK